MIPNCDGTTDNIDIIFSNNFLPMPKIILVPINDDGRAIFT